MYLTSVQGPGLYCLISSGIFDSAMLSPHLYHIGNIPKYMIPQAAGKSNLQMPILLDFGTKNYDLVKEKIDLKNINEIIIIISHNHTDHLFGIFKLLNKLVKYDKKVTVFMPAKGFSLSKQRKPCLFATFFITSIPCLFAI